MFALSAAPRRPLHAAPAATPLVRALVLLALAQHVLPQTVVSAPPPVASSNKIITSGDYKCVIYSNDEVRKLRKLPELGPVLLPPGGPTLYKFHITSEGCAVIDATVIACDVGSAPELTVNTLVRELRVRRTSPTFVQSKNHAVVHTVAYCEWPKDAPNVQP